MVLFISLTGFLEAANDGRETAQTQREKTVEAGFRGCRREVHICRRRRQREVHIVHKYSGVATVLSSSPGKCQSQTPRLIRDDGAGFEREGVAAGGGSARSEERRVGKEWRSRWA